ncbi:hypothetical protein DL89DRAFT_37073 [Linderina pennispora]|uniref:Uncharacterized protein n=1 Tax=Linderina pennispora TaxID=61395 RepID=A0A1Y1W308_9FUNG|nr:uncharacterized protein DL89DRAFT_37073 [Linderina pennispora]ORX67837.1 hypothetical protein DL89DRAFT_37073 [Linderina pennispora]
MLQIRSRPKLDKGEPPGTAPVFLSVIRRTDKGLACSRNSFDLLLGRLERQVADKDNEPHLVAGLADLRLELLLRLILCCLLGLLLALRLLGLGLLLLFVNCVVVSGFVRVSIRLVVLDWLVILGRLGDLAAELQGLELLLCQCQLRFLLVGHCPEMCAKKKVEGRWRGQKKYFFGCQQYFLFDEPSRSHRDP